MSTKVNHNEINTQLPIEYRRIMNYGEEFIKILQYNVINSSDIVMVTLLRDLRIPEYNILALQGPWRNPLISTIRNSIAHSF